MTAPAGATLDVSGVTTTTTQTDQTVTVTAAGTGIESVPVSAQLSLTMASEDGVTTTLNAGTVASLRQTTLTVGDGLLIQSGTLDDGRTVTVSTDGTQVAFDA